MKARRGDGWTEQDDEIIRRMAAADASSFLIAAKLKRSEPAVKKRAWSMGVKILTLNDKRARLKAATAPPGEE